MSALLITLALAASHPDTANAAPAPAAPAAMKDCCAEMKAKGKDCCCCGKGMAEGHDDHGAHHEEAPAAAPHAH